VSGGCGSHASLREPSVLKPTIALTCPLCSPSVKTTHQARNTACFFLCFFPSPLCCSCAPDFFAPLAILSYLASRHPSCPSPSNHRAPPHHPLDLILVQLPIAVLRSSPSNVPTSHLPSHLLLCSLRLVLLCLSLSLALSLSLSCAARLSCYSQHSRLTDYSAPSSVAPSLLYCVHVHCRSTIVVIV
jgi:hypothetical protein